MSETSDFGLYLHIPYCISKCPYCAFNSYGTGEVPPEYMSALAAEVAWTAAFFHLHERITDTVYFGGGTPSLMKPEALQFILDKIRNVFILAPDVEITLEVNPAFNERNFFGILREAGINRLSIGIQSFNDRHLAFLGRAHNNRQGEETIRAAREAGFDNISLDLICGLPGQTINELLSDLERATSFGSEHLSVYLLAFEEGTPFRERYKNYLWDEGHEDRGGECYLAATEFLEGRGYERYETSNFARAGFQSRHNKRYWTGEDYIGLGAGAHSHLSDFGWGARWWNEKSPATYMESLQEGHLPMADLELLDRTQAIRETLMTGLRKKEGVDSGELEARFGLPLRDFVSPDALEQIPRRLYKYDGINLFLTHEGALMADEIATRLCR